MRVISGSARGLKLNSPINNDVRPTTDRVKESMFNIISSRVYDGDVLDLFAGSGALGIECISRGASKVVFCDKSKDSIDVLKSNLEKIKCDKSVYEIIAGDFRNALKKIPSKKISSFDIIFIDPPYYEGLFEEAINLIVENNILCEDGIIVVEHDSNTDLPDFSNIYKIKEKKYGMTKLTFYSLEEDYE